MTRKEPGTRPTLGGNTAKQMRSSEEDKASFKIRGWGNSIYDRNMVGRDSKEGGLLGFLKDAKRLAYPSIQILLCSVLFVLWVDHSNQPLHRTVD